MMSLTRREFDAVSADLTRAWIDAARRDRLMQFRQRVMRSGAAIAPLYEAPSSKLQARLRRFAQDLS
jgi:hypothetical protein